MNWKVVLKNQKTFQGLSVGELSSDSMLEEDTEDCFDRLKKIQRTLKNISLPNFYEAKNANHKINLLHRDAKKKQPHLEEWELIGGVSSSDPHAEQPKYPSFEIDVKLESIPRSVACKAVELIDEVIQNPKWESVPETVKLDGYLLSVGVAYLGSDYSRFFDNDDIILADVQIRIQKGDAWGYMHESDVLLGFTVRAWNVVENGIDREKMRQKMISYFK